MKKAYVKVSLDDLKEYWKNNKIHSEYDIWEIVKSIQKCTYLSPIIVDEKFEIINWHGRKEALKKLWQKEVEVLQITGLSEKQKRSARLLDNKTNSLSVFNVENIKFELDELWDEEINDLFSDLIIEKIDYEDIYKGMPEYNQEDLTSEYQIKVSFKDVKALEDFWRVIGQKLTEKTRSIRYPAQAREDLASTKIVDEE